MSNFGFALVVVGIIITLLGVFDAFGDGDASTIISWVGTGPYSCYFFADV